MFDKCIKLKINKVEEIWKEVLKQEEKVILNEYARLRYLKEHRKIEYTILLIK